MRTSALGAAALLALAIPAQAAESGADQGFALRQADLALFGNDGLGVGVADTRLRGWWGGSVEGGAPAWLPPLRWQLAGDSDLGFSTTPGSGLALLFGGSPGAGQGGSQTTPLLWRPLSVSGGNPAVASRAWLDRADVQARLGTYDLDLGRQPITLGTSHGVGVLDVLAPFSPGALDTTYKPGIDALRVRATLGEATEVEGLAAGADPTGSGAVLALGRVPFAGFDWQGVAGHFRWRNFAGLGWEGELRGEGVWGELAAFQRRPDVEQVRGGGSSAALSGVVGVDWALPADWKLTTGVLHQDFGARHPAELAAVRQDAPYSEGWVFLGASDYAVLTVQKPLDPLWTVSGLVLVNLTDGSTLWEPRVTTSIGDEADLGVYGFAGAGAGLQTTPTGPAPGSEFGLVSAGGGLYARWFF